MATRSQTNTSRQQSLPEREAPTAPHAGGDPGESSPTNTTTTTTLARRGQKRSLPAGTLRTAVACRACRERKTRCSGHQPACTYCSKAGVACEYVSETYTSAAPVVVSSSLDEWGERILSAVEGIARNLNLSQQQQLAVGVSPGPSHNTIDAGATEPADVSSTDQQSCRKRRRVSIFSRLSDDEIPITGPSAVAGLASVLEWNTFSGHGSEELGSALSSARLRQSSHKSGLESASCAASELSALAAAFEGFFLPALQILNPTDMRRLVRDSGEFGITWSIESCLVLLVAALGGMCRQDSSTAQSQTPWGTPHLSSPGSSLRSGSGGSERRTPTAIRYWNMAKKRLVWATSAPGLVAAQCQFLAGIWHLHSSEPLASWKMLSGALLSLDEEDDRDLSQDPGSEDLLRRNIRRTTLILICRLRCDVNISFAPGSYSMAPNNSGEASDFQSADMDLLCIRQKGCIDQDLLHEDMSIEEVCAFHTRLSATQQALRLWYESLPAHLKFSIYPDNEQTAEQVALGVEQEQHQRLQYSYYETEELLLRPSLYMLLNVKVLTEQTTSSIAREIRAHPGSSMREQVIARLRDVSLRHRVSMLLRVKLCLDPYMAQPLVIETGWLKRQTCATLALLLVASERACRDNSIPQPEGPGVGDTSLVTVIDMIEEFLAQDRLCSDVSKSYLNLLRRIRGQPGSEV